MDNEKILNTPHVLTDPESPSARTAMMLGEEAVRRLRSSSVMVVGLGGVGGHALEAIARAGVGKICVVDGDRVSTSNLNRQLLATRDTVGMLKTEAARRRIKSIDPEIEVIELPLFVTEENVGELNIGSYGYVVDAIDSVGAKVALVKEAKKHGVPILCSMGTGNKLDPTRFRITDIEKTSVDPLARVIRQRLRKEDIRGVSVLWSDEPPIHTGERTPGSVSFVPSAAGIIIASRVLTDLAGIKQQ